MHSVTFVLVVVSSAVVDIPYYRRHDDIIKDRSLDLFRVFDVLKAELFAVDINKVM